MVKRMTDRLMDLITADSLNRRLFVLWGIGVAINLVAWNIGFHFLPEGVLRGALPAPEFIPDSGGWQGVFWSILVYNIGLAGGLIVVANLFRIGRLPLGYVPVLFHWALFGLFLGTNSFGVVRDRSTAPDILSLIRSPGFAELSAYTFLAAASIGLHMYRQESFWQLGSQRVRRWADVSLERCELVTIAVAVLLVVTGAVVEAGNILG